MLSLTVIDGARPPPKDMLAHPWIQENMRKEVPMARWIREVWGWPKKGGPPKNRRAGYNPVQLTPIQRDVYGEQFPIPQAISPKLESPGVNRRGRFPVNRSTPPHGQLNNRVLHPSQPTQVLTPCSAQASYAGFPYPFHSQRRVNTATTG